MRAAVTQGITLHGGLFLAALLVGFLLTPVPARGQGGTVEWITVHGASLEGNLSGDSPDRSVAVYLPPAYELDKDRRYPVIYMLHGFTDDVSNWFGTEPHWIHLPDVLDEGFGAPGVQGMIVVMPGAYTKFSGSMYSNSVTTGFWEDFVTTDLVEYVDARYRTLPHPESRGLAGHSMGGYGTVRIGMKHPEVFSAFYALSPCCMTPMGSGPPSGRSSQGPERVTTMEEFRQAPFGVKAVIAQAAAWAPNPSAPPFYLDLPTENGEARPEILAKFGANSPIAMVDQYIANLRRLRGFGFDAGDDDGGITLSVRELHRILEGYGTPHVFEIYEGDHLSGVAGQIITRVIPFFSRLLAPQAGEAGNPTRE